MSTPLLVLVIWGHFDWLPYAAFGALASVYGKRGTRRQRAGAQALAGAALVVSVTMGAIAGASGLEPAVLLALASSSVVGLGLTWTAGLAPVPSLFLVFATGTVSAVTQTWTTLPAAAAVSMGAALFALLMGQLFAKTGSRDLADVRVRRAAALGSTRLPTLVLLYATLPVVAGLLATAAGLGHPYWAAVASVVPLAGASLFDKLGRGIHRLAGTIVGIAIAIAFLSMQPPVWVMVVAIALFQLLTELFVTRNYALAVIWITPLALTLSSLGDVSRTGVLVFDRVVGSGIGLGLAMMTLAVGYLVRSGRAERVRPRTN
ncbi:FUSC family protein [Microbacterium sp. B2969]|uniref:FUSC family protein n=1 Tax=Microbacterium alkaliflavum TaxID=3248839 RepID=A0ABW7QE27_9MICO